MPFWKWKTPKEERLEGLRDKMADFFGELRSDEIDDIRNAYYKALKYPLGKSRGAVHMMLVAKLQQYGIAVKSYKDALKACEKILAGDNNDD